MMRAVLFLLAFLSVTIAQSTECTVCEFLVKTAEGLIHNNQTESEVLTFLENACTVLPAGMSGECSSLVAAWGPTVLDMIIKGSSPQAICARIGVCTSQKRDTEQGGACSVCELVVTYVESWVASNQTETQIIQQLDQLCSLLGPFESTCDAFASQYVPQLIQWIEAGESPQQFCTQVGLCSSVAKAHHHKRDVEQGGACSICQLVVSYVESYLANNQTEAQIIQQLDQVCALLPGSFSSMCDSFVAQYVPQLIQWIEAGESPQQFCTQVGLCSSAKVHHKREVEQGGACSICQLVVSYVESYLANNQTEAQIIQQLDQVCALLPGSFSSMCDSFVAQYVPQLIQWIEAGESPQQFCTQVGLCSSAKKVEHHHHKRDVEQGGACSICQLVVSYVESYLANNQTEAQIIQQLDQVCALLPGSFSSMCDSFVAQYVPQLIQWIEAGESPQQFCTQVGLCSSAKKVEHHHHKRDVEQGGVCSVCQLVVQYVESYIASNQTEAQIIAQLEQLCSLLGPLSSQCNAFVENYVPDLIQWIENGESPQQFCTQVGLCSSVEVQHKLAQVQKPASKPKRSIAEKRIVQGNCAICETLVLYVEQYLAEAATEAQMEQKLDELCSLLPSVFQGQCTSLISEYLPQMIQSVIAKENPLAFCTTLGVCK